ncbi:MAG: FHA domain-containing protein [Spirochaetaceae bacterium]|jgi:MFS family permease|nr:FHA domain-containing protein [Spirochaetaceae bacterium]
MTSRGKFVLYALIGLLGGAASFATVDLLLRFQESFSSYLSFNLLLGASFGIMLGVFLGSAEGIVHSNRHKVLTGILVGVLVGALGGILGVHYGQSLLLSLLSRSSYQDSLPLGLSLFFRALSWSVMGILIGMVEGIRARSGIKIFYGMLGGLFGGFLGGILLELINHFSRSYALSRLLGMLVLGSLIGVFYAILERNFTPGVFRVLNGSLKGKKLALNQRKLTVGFSNRNDLALNGYNGVEKLHSVITVRGDQVQILPFRNAYTIMVNDEKVDQAVLKYHDVIAVGDARFLFEVK